MDEYIDIGTQAIDPAVLAKELRAAGIPAVGIAITGPQLRMYTAEGVPIPPTPEAEAVIDAHDATKTSRDQAFAKQEDVERIALVQARAEEDPAFAALAELTLGKQPGGAP